VRLRTCLGLIVVTLLLSVGAGAQERGLFQPATHEPKSTVWGYSTWPHDGTSLLYAQGWNSYGYGNSYFGGHGYQLYNGTPHFPYLYYYEQYSRQAEESRRAANEYEASLAREGKLTGQLEVGAFKTDFIPRSPLRQQATLDGHPVAHSHRGAALVIESGEHTLTIGPSDADPRK
jgi:hypothetical protein